MDGDHIVNGQSRYGLELLGPVVSNGSWQAKDEQAYDISKFAIDWQRQLVTCPQGKISRKWTQRQERTVPLVIRAQFGKHDCLTCPGRSLCTTATTNPRQVTFRPQAQHEAIQMARERQQTPAFKARYAKRAGVEGTISQGVRAFDLRRSRYLGEAKTHLQHVITAGAMNVTRLLAWLMDGSLGERPVSRFAALAA